jgi:hypothetical protein
VEPLKPSPITTWNFLVLWVEATCQLADSIDSVHIPLLQFGVQALVHIFPPARQLISME